MSDNPWGDFNQSLQFLGQSVSNTQIANNNYKLNQRALEEAKRQYDQNFEYTSALNKLSMDRADTYYSRMSKDLELAGINPRILSGNSGQAAVQANMSPTARSSAGNSVQGGPPPAYTNPGMSPLDTALYEKTKNESAYISAQTTREQQQTMIDHLQQILESKKVEIMASNLDETKKATLIRQLEADISKKMAEVSERNVSVAEGRLEFDRLQAVEQSRQFEKALEKGHKYDDLHAGLAVSASARESEKHQYQISEIASRIDSTTAKTVAQKIENILSEKLGTVNRTDRDYVARVLIDNGMDATKAYRTVEHRALLTNILKALEGAGAVTTGWRNKGTGGTPDTKMPKRDPWITN